MAIGLSRETQFHRFTVAAYHRMIELGILTENHHLELIEGEVVWRADWRSLHLRGTATLERYGFSPDEYRQLVAAGLVRPEDRVARGDGDWRDWMTFGDPHCACVDMLHEALLLTIGRRAKVRSQNPVVLDTTEPEPDGSVVHRKPDNYLSGKPRAADTLLVIEVADSSFPLDRDVKGPIYARNGIPEYWIVNLNDDTVHVYRGPQPDGTWASHDQLTRGETLTVAALPGVSIPVNDILP